MDPLLLNAFMATPVFSVFMIVIYIIIGLCLLDFIVFYAIPKIRKWWYGCNSWFFFNVISKWHWGNLRKKLNANHKYYVPWDIGEFAVENLFMQFKTYYEMNKKKFIPVEAEMTRKWFEIESLGFDAKQRKQYINHLVTVQMAYTAINEIYKYLTITREANKQLIDAIYHEMFEGITFRDLGNRKGFAIENVQHFKLKYHYSEFHHLIIDEKKPTAKGGDLKDMMILEGSALEQDNQIAKQIIDLRVFMTD